MPGKSRRSSKNDASSTNASSSYADIMGLPGDRTNDSPSMDDMISGGNSNNNNNNNTDGDTTEPSAALSNRLVDFRKWLTADAGVTVHGALCIVNGEATDGTRQAPVLVMERAPGNISNANAGLEGRLGAEAAAQALLWDRTMGCQLRVTRDVKPGDVLLEVPRSAMISPDVVAASAAGRAVAACVENNNSGDDDEAGFWDRFENTTLCEQRQLTEKKFAGSTGPQLLVKALQERKRVEGLEQKWKNDDSDDDDDDDTTTTTLAAAKTISTRAPLLAFLIHQRFSDGRSPPVKVPLDDIDVDDSIQLPDQAPESYAAYARTLPSTISIPLCWKREELALLTGCPPGVPVLVEVATATAQLAAEFSALLKAGITQRFPQIFPEGLLTWERWVWAAACVTSRTLPATLYFDRGCGTGEEFRAVAPMSECQSPGAIWDELGVLVPLMDMMNHEGSAHQVEWQPPPGANGNHDEDNSDGSSSSPPPPELHNPRAIAKTKIKKGCEAYTCYGLLSNHEMLLRYGFCQMNNADDQVKLGWTLQDAVGRVKAPDNFEALVVIDDQVYESPAADSDSVENWWTQDRLKLLEEEAFRKSPQLVVDMQKGSRFIWGLMAEGALDPIFLTTAVVSTMPARDVRHHKQGKSNIDEGEEHQLVLSLRHQKILRNYLAFHLTQRLEKLLSKLNSGLVSNFDSDKKLWESAAKGGLAHKAVEGEGDDDVVGWQEFFDTHAYSSSIGVEESYYAMGSDSCVLTLYDGQTRILQAAIDIMRDETKFQDVIGKQLTDLGFVLGTMEDHASMGEGGSDAGGKSPSRRKRKDRKKQQQHQQTLTTSAGSTNRQPAMKLHVGNLSYETTPSNLYDYFSERYGKDNILECHIPVERDTGQSRGFGFVTLPEAAAQLVLDESKQHEIGGRLVRIAKSNSAGSNSQNRAATARATVNSERCSNCGYRPRYCVCGGGGGGGNSSRPDREFDRDRDRDLGYYGSGPPPPPDRYGDHPRGDRRYRDPSPPYHDRGRDRERERTRSWDRDRGRDRDGDREWDRDRYDRDRYYEERDRYRYDDSPPRDYEDRHRSRSRRRRSRSRSSGRRRDYHDDDRSFRRSGRDDDYDGDRKRSRDDDYDGDRKQRSRSRSRSRSRGRRKKSKRRRSRSRSPSHGSKGGK